jgi:hypothetical protein
MKKLILAMMIVPLLCACNSTSKYSYVDNSDTLEVTRNADGKKDIFEVKFLSDDYSDGSSIRARYIGTEEELMGVKVLFVTGELKRNKFDGVTLESLQGGSWAFSADLSLWFDEGI